MSGYILFFYVGAISCAFPHLVFMTALAKRRLNYHFKRENSVRKLDQGHPIIASGMQYDNAVWRHHLPDVRRAAGHRWSFRRSGNVSNGKFFAL